MQSLTSITHQIQDTKTRIEKMRIEMGLTALLNEAMTERAAYVIKMDGISETCAKNSALVKEIAELLRVYYYHQNNVVGRKRSQSQELRDVIISNSHNKHLQEVLKTAYDSGYFSKEYIRRVPSTISPEKTVIPFLPAEYEYLCYDIDNNAQMEYFASIVEGNADHLTTYQNGIDAFDSKIEELQDMLAAVRIQNAVESKAEEILPVLQLPVLQLDEAPALGRAHSIKRPEPLLFSDAFASRTQRNFIDFPVIVDFKKLPTIPELPEFPETVQEMSEVKAPEVTTVEVRTVRPRF